MALRRISQRDFHNLAAPVLMASSFSMLSFYQIIELSKWTIIVTVLTAFVCGFCFYEAAARENLAYIKAHPYHCAAALFCAAAILWQMYLQKGAPRYDTFFAPLPFHFFRPAYWALALPGLFFLLLWGLRKARDFLLRFREGMDRTDRRMYLAVTAASSAVIMAAYISNPQWYMQFDSVYSIDAGYCVTTLFPVASYYYIVHPTLGLLTFPVWAVTQTALGLFAPSNLILTLTAACVQILNVQFLLLSGFMLARLAGNRWTLALYLCSLPMFLFTMFIEKCQIITFLMVLYVYLRTEPREEVPLRKRRKAPRVHGRKRVPLAGFLMDGGGHELNLMLSTGGIAFAGILYLCELFRREGRAAKLRGIARTAAWGVLFLICTGRAHMLAPLYIFNNTFEAVGLFGHQGTLPERCASFMNLVQGCFIGLSSQVGTGRSYAPTAYMWGDPLSQVPRLSVLLLALILVGAAVRWKEPFTKYCALWLAGAAVLLIAAQWAIHVSPLFGVYFFWVLIPLFQQGLQFCVEKFRWRERAVYGGVLISMLAVNAAVMLDVAKFLRGL